MLPWVEPTISIASLYALVCFVYERITAEPMPEAGATFAVLLRLQSLRFKWWGISWGADQENVLEKKLRARGSEGNEVYREISVTLARINQLFARAYKFEERYEKDILPKLQELRGSGVVDQSSSISQTVRRFLASTLHRVTWSIGDKKRFQEMVQTLTDFNNSLESLLPPSLNPRSFQYQFAASYFSDRPPSNASAETANSEFVTLVSDFKLLAHKLEQLVDSTSSGQRTPSPEPILQALEHFGEELRNPSILKSMVSREQAPLVPESLSPEDNRTFARFGEKPVILEFKPYTLDIADTIKFRVQVLAFKLAQSPKPEGFCFLDCIGWYKDPSPSYLRYALLYSYPHGTDITKKPVSLASLFADREERRYAYPLPSLEQRLKLAHTLAVGCFSLLLVEWVHKGLRPHNVLFFYTNPTADQPSRLWLENPFIVGFDYSRPNPNDGSVQISNERADFPPEYNLYLHKDVSMSPPLQPTLALAPVSSRTVPFGTQPIFKPYYDMYALALILLEIGLWRSIRRIYGKVCQQWDEQSFSDFTAEMQRSSGEELAHRSGTRYQAVVSQFFRDPSIRELGGEEKVWFWEHVVAPLGRCAEELGMTM